VDATEPEGYPVVSNFPNPFNAGTTFQVQLPLTAEVSLVLYNLMGQKIRTLLEGSMQAGDRSVAWDGADDAGAAAPSGVYLAVLRAQGAGRAFIATRKILRLD
jgi:flagellar hook assembly protein FlgD